MKRATFLLASLAMLFLVGAPAARACNVPVFRYALERWPADPYVITILHGGELTRSDKEVVKALGTIGETAANVEIQLANMNAVIPACIRERFSKQIESSLPLMLVDYPARDGIPRFAWFSKLSAPGVKTLVDSPARRELAKRLLKGQSAVWLLLESGDEKADAAALKSIDETSAKLEKELKLPEPDPNDPRMNADVPLAIKFSSLKVSRRDPAEQVLVSMLLSIHPALLREKGPIAFPIFGRGRLLAGLAGSRLDADTMTDAAAFITGACSCEAKSQNPGIDLLLAADWDGLIAGRVVKDPELPPLIGMSQFAAPVPTANTQTPVAKIQMDTVFSVTVTTAPIAASPQTAPYWALKRNLLIVAGAGVLVLILGSFAMKRRAQ